MAVYFKEKLYLVLTFTAFYFIAFLFFTDMLILIMGTVITHNKLFIQMIIHIEGYRYPLCMDPQAILSWLSFVNMFMLFLIACVLYVKYQRSLENKEIVELTNKLLQERYGNLKDIYDAEAKMSHDHQAALAYMETLSKKLSIKL